MASKTTTSQLRWIGMGAVLAAAAAACGYPTFSYGPAADAPCRLMHEAEDCQPDHKCTVTDVNTGDAHCAPVPANPLEKYASCFKEGITEDRCPAQTWCDGRTRVCMPFCTSAAECGEGSCVAAQSLEDKLIPGTNVCTAHCDPIGAAPCGAAATCTYDSALGDLDCVFSSELALGAACEYLNDCGQGLVCVGKLCSNWCHPAGSKSPDCMTGMLCRTFSNLTVMYDDISYGFCN